MDILLISDEDTCRTRIAEELLASFGRGMKFFTAGLIKGVRISELVLEELKSRGYDPSERAPLSLDFYNRMSWDAIITLSKQSEDDFKDLGMNAQHIYHLSFCSPFNNEGQTNQSVEERMQNLYREMFQKLYELYRDELTEHLLPRCTCGANTYCRCE